MQIEFSKSKTEYIKQEAKDYEVSVEKFIRATLPFLLDGMADFIMMKEYGLDVHGILSRVKTIEVSQLDEERLVVTTNTIFTEEEREVATEVKNKITINSFGGIDFDAFDKWVKELKKQTEW